MDVDVIGEDRYGSAAYAKLFEEIMGDLNKATLIERVKLVLKPEVPLFVFSVVLKAAPSRKTIPDAATIRFEIDGVHVTITQERYAPDILRVLWARYGRSNVVQQTRFDLDVAGAKEEELAEMEISSGEEDMREIMGAIWRTMPEGIKNRKALIDGHIITVVATEEILKPEMLEEGIQIHRFMGGGARCSRS